MQPPTWKGEQDPLQPPEPAPRFTRAQIVAVVAILIAAAVPIALQFGVDLCSISDGLGIELAACERASTPVEPEPSPMEERDTARPSPRTRGDSGAP